MGPFFEILLKHLAQIWADWYISGSLFLKNWYLYGSTFKFCGRHVLTKTKLEYPPGEKQSAQIGFVQLCILSTKKSTER